jgi:type I restriction enzyme R subunit
MKQIRATEVTKAAVEYQGVMTGGGRVKLQPGKGKKGVGPPPVKVSVQDMAPFTRALPRHEIHLIVASQCYAL